ncbi:MAG TPA: hypothetical protein VHT27_02985 [Solirubrobacteraceae bacterium]|jgi:hypothetical protein|nr:hypothetical protein [Solirubrobacteraceae bacterium]
MHAGDHRGFGRLLTAAGRVAFGTLIGLALLGVSAEAHTDRVSARAASAPKTVLECQQAFKNNGTKRASCIARVKSEKPGASCKHPLKSSFTGAAEKVGDTSDFTVEVMRNHDPDLAQGESMRLWVLVTLHSNRVVLCPKIELRVHEYATDPHEISRTFFPSIGPEGGRSSTVEALDGWYQATAFARFKHP